MIWVSALYGDVVSVNRGIFEIYLALKPVRCYRGVALSEVLDECEWRGAEEKLCDGEL